MATTTTNFALRKPAGTDTVAVTTDISDSMDTADTQLARFGFKGTDIASAATLTLPAQGSVFDITGTTTVTAISTRTAGETVILQFDGALTLTHNATSLALGGNANATTAAGDVHIFASEGSGNWREVNRFIRTQDMSAFLTTTTGWRRAGGNTTEGSTTSTTAVDIVTVSGLSITAATPFIVTGLWRKTSGAAATADVGLKLNTTTVFATATWNTASGANQAENGAFRYVVGPRIANYLRGGMVASTNGIAAANNMDDRGFTADAPTATITDVIIVGLVSSALITLAIDEVHVYTLPTS